MTMTLLGERMQALKEANVKDNLRKAKEVAEVYNELAAALKVVFDDALASDDVRYVSELSKLCAVKKPKVVCVIAPDRATLSVNFENYKDGAYSALDDNSKYILMAMSAEALSEWYPEYRFESKSRSIYVTEKPVISERESWVKWFKKLIIPREPL